MVISVIPILCETSARWLGRGRSSTSDCAGLTSDMAAISRQNGNPRKAALNMRKCLLRFKRLVVSHTHDPVIGMWRNSMRFVGFIVHACVGRDPVYFPSLASIIRECLFKAARIRSDIRHDKSNVDGSAIKTFLIEKLAAPIVELADCGLVQGTVDAVDKIEAPLVGLGIVQTQG